MRHAGHGVSQPSLDARRRRRTVRPRGFAAWILALAVLGTSAQSVLAQGRPHEIECFSLLFSACRNYVIQVVAVLPDGTKQPQDDRDTLEELALETAEPASYLVLELFKDDRLQGSRAVIWVRRATGEVGGDWPGVLSNDFVRSVALKGVPGDVVEFHDQRDFGPGGAVARMVIFAGNSDCVTDVSFDRGGPCTVAERGGVAGKVSGIRIEYRVAPAAAGAPAPEIPPGAPALPGAPPAPPGAARQPGAPPVPPEMPPGVPVPPAAPPGPQPPPNAVPAAPPETPAAADTAPHAAPPAPPQGRP